jgi:hypothetical protein
MSADLVHSELSSHACAALVGLSEPRKVSFGAISPLPTPSGRVAMLLAPVPQLCVPSVENMLKIMRAGCVNYKCVWRCGGPVFVRLCFFLIF